MNARQRRVQRRRRRSLIARPTATPASTAADIASAIAKQAQAKGYTAEVRGSTVLVDMIVSPLSFFTVELTS